MKTLGLSPVEMTGDIMESLERRGLITRLCPNHDELAPPLGETAWKMLYEPREGYGPHKLISVTVNREEFAAFGVHPDNEEFWLIGDSDTQPLYLAVSLLTAEALSAKIAGGTLEASDFVALRVTATAPRDSLFVTRATAPHGEASVNAGKRPPTLYVTESRDLPLPLTDMGDYRLKIL
jgi:hypothetical protein